VDIYSTLSVLSKKDRSGLDCSRHLTQGPAVITQQPDRVATTLGRHVSNTCRPNHLSDSRLKIESYGCKDTARVPLSTGFTALL
jgi:hypothetical protein